MRATGNGSRDFAGSRSRVRACLFEEKGVIPRYTRSRETIFRALSLKRNGKKRCALTG